MGKCFSGCIGLVLFGALLGSSLSIASLDQDLPVHVRLASAIRCAHTAEGAKYVDLNELAAVESAVQVLTRGKEFVAPEAFVPSYQQFIDQVLIDAYQVGTVSPLQEKFIQRIRQLSDELANGRTFSSLDPGLELALLGRALLNPSLLYQKDSVGVPRPSVAESEDPVSEWRRRFVQTLGQSLGQAKTNILYIPTIGEPGGLKRASLIGLPIAYLNIQRSQDPAVGFKFKGNPDLSGVDEFEFDLKRAAHSLYWLVPALASEFKPAAGFIVEKQKNVMTYAFDAQELLSNHVYLFRALTEAVSEEGFEHSVPREHQDLIGSMFMMLTQVRMNQGVLLTPEILLRRTSQLNYWLRGGTTDKMPEEKIDLFKSRIADALQAQIPQ